MEVRKSTDKDVREILEIYCIAREYMITHGNTTQWGEGYPSKEILENDIADGNNYVVVDDGEIVGTFTFIIGDEPTYQVIKNGNWSKEEAYGTFHRIASNGKTKGVAKACFAYGLNMIDYVRIDTHKENLAMQSAITKYGFKVCGNIYVRNGSERIAYDYSCK